jgi:ribosome-associated protein
MSENPTIRLGQYLKLAGLAGTGGEAKYLIQEGLVRVNGEVETRRKRQLHPGDRVEFQEHTLTVTAADTGRPARAGSTAQPGKGAG